jgi:hypothetical protein
MGAAYLKKYRMTVSVILKQMILQLALITGLWLLQLYGRVLPTTAVLLLWVLLGLLLGRGLWLQASLQRRVWLAAFIRSGSGLQTLLQGGLFMMLMQVLPAMLLASLLLAALLRSADPVMWQLLLLGVLALPLALALATVVLRAHASVVYLPALAWRVGSFIVGLLLLAGLLAVALTAQYPDLGASSLEQSVWYMLSQEQARSAPLLSLLQVAAATDGLKLWLGQALLPAPAESVWQLLGWTIVFVQEVLFVWSLLLMSRAVVYLPLIASNEEGSHEPALSRDRNT